MCFSYFVSSNGPPPSYTLATLDRQARRQDRCSRSWEKIEEEQSINAAQKTAPGRQNEQDHQLNGVKVSDEIQVQMRKTTDDTGQVLQILLQNIVSRSYRLGVSEIAILA